MTENSYLFATECENIHKSAIQKGINTTNTSLDKMNMIYKMELEDNTVIYMQRDVTYNYVEKEQQDVLEIALKDKNYSVSFIINNNKYKSNLFVITMINDKMDHKSGKQLSIEPHAFYSLAKVTGDRKKDYNKTIINTSIQDKYMKLIDEFVRYISKKDNVNLSTSYIVIREEIGNIVENMTQHYELRNSKSKKRTKK